MSIVNVYCEKDSICIENTYGEDGEYSGYHHDEYVNHEVTFSNKKKNDYTFEDSFEVEDLNDAYLVYVLYSSGGTFGRTDGYFKAIGIYNLEEAKRIQGLIFDTQNLRYNPSKKEKEKFLESFKKLDELHIYSCWTGYFENLNDCIIMKVQINDFDSKGRPIR